MNLGIDKGEVVQFFENMYDIEPWPGIINVDFIKVTEVLDENKQRKTVRESIHRHPIACLDQIQKLDISIWSKKQQELGNVFFTVGFIDPKAKRNLLSNVVAVPAMWADIDDVSEERLQELLVHVPLTPTGIIRSGAGVHFYWKLREYCYDTKKGGAVEQAALKVHAWITGDHTHNLNRLLRLPGTYNVKPKYMQNGHHPPKAELLRWDRNIVYTIDQILDISISYFELRVPREFRNRYILNGECTFEGKEDRSKRDFRIAVEMLSYNHTEEEVRATLSNKKWGCSSKATEEGVWSEYIAKTIESAAQTAKTMQVGFSVFDNVTKSTIIRKKIKSNGAVEEEVISNFCVVPLRRVTIMDNGTFIDEIIEARTHTTFGKDRVSTMSIGHFTHPDKFLTNNGIAMCTFWGEKRDFNMYVDYLSRQEVPTSVASASIGWCKDSFVLPDRILYGQATDIEYIDTLGVNPAIYVSNEPFPFTQDSIRELYRHVKHLHMPSVSIFSFGWMLAAAFAQKIRDQYYQQFPLLCLHGQQGSGKTTLARTYIHNLFGYTDELSGGASRAGVRNTLASLNSIPVLIDEFDCVEFSKDDIHMILRALWQAGFVPRMKQGKQELSKMKLTAPACLTTMVGITDLAVQDRAVNLRTNRIDFKAASEHKLWFENLPRGAFLNSWVQQDSSEWIPMIAEIGRKLGDSPRQQHSFGCAAAPLLWLATKGMILDLTIDSLLAYWGGHTDTPVSAINAIDQILSYLIREFFVLPSTDHGYRVDGTTLIIAAAAFVDTAMEKCERLKLSFPIDRKWILETLKDGVKNGEIISRDRQQWRSNKNVRCIVFDLNAFPLTKEVVCGETTTESRANN